MRKLLLNPTPLFRKLRQLSMLLTLLLALPQTAWGQEITKTYTFTGTTLSGNAGTATSTITGGAGAETYTWNIPNFSREASGYAYNDGTVTPSNSILGFSGEGISRKLENSAYHAVQTTFVLESEAFTGEFVSATIEGYSSTGMSTAQVQVLRYDGQYRSPLSYNTTDDPNNGYTNLSSTTSLPMSTSQVHTSNKYLDGHKLHFLFKFESDNQSDNASFEIGSITITTKTTNYNLTVAGTQVTSDNKRDILTGSNEGKVSYDPNTNTLTLNGAEITGGIVYSGTGELTIALNGTNSINNTTGPAINTQAATSASGTIKIIKASGASSAELTATGGSGSSPIVSGTTLGTGLYWKPISQNQMVITEDPNFLILDGVVIPDGTTINGTSGSLIYNTSSKTLSLNGYEKDFGSRHAIKTGVSGLKVKLIGASTIYCSADSAVFHAFSSSASIQFIKNDATSKLTMTGTDFDRFAANSVTYDGFIYYSSQTTKGITQAAAPELGKLTKVDAGSYYTFATIDYADSDKSGSDAIYKDASPVLKYSFDYADSQKQDVSDQTYPAEGIKMTDPGILTAWVEVGTYKGPEAKGVRFGFIENPFEMEFNGTAKEVSITPAPTMTNPVTYSVRSDSQSDFDGFAVLNATNNKITINNCYKGNIGFSFSNTDGGYTSLNDSTNITFNVLPSKPTLSLESGAYYVNQELTATPKLTGTEYSTTLTINSNNNQTSPYTFNTVGRYDVSATTKYTPSGSNFSYDSTPAEATYIINNQPVISAVYNDQTAYDGTKNGNVTYSIGIALLQSNCTLMYYYGTDKSKAAAYTNTVDTVLVESKTVNAFIRYTDGTTTYDTAPVTVSYTVKQDLGINFAADQSYQTYYLSDYSLNKPQGLKAYIITGISENSVKTTAIDYIPQGVAVLLEKDGAAPAGGYVADTYTGTAGNFAGNLLKYTGANAVVNTTGKEYILYKNEFVKATGTINGACYLDLNGVAPARGMYGIGNDGSTAIEGIDVEATEDETWYDLQGRRIQKPTKAGIYIVNGKKVIINNK